MHTPTHRGGTKSTTRLKTFYRIDAEHGLAEVGVEFVKYGFAQSRWHTLGDEGDNASKGIARVAGFFDEPAHFSCCFFIGTSQFIFRKGKINILRSGIQPGFGNGAYKRLDGDAL